jgi:hypothetical protein
MRGRAVLFTLSSERAVEMVGRSGDWAWAWYAVLLEVLLADDVVVVLSRGVFVGVAVNVEMYCMTRMAGLPLSR